MFSYNLMCRACITLYLNRLNNYCFPLVKQKLCYFKHKRYIPLHLRNLKPVEVFKSNQSSEMSKFIKVCFLSSRIVILTSARVPGAGAGRRQLWSVLHITHNGSQGPSYGTPACARAGPRPAWMPLGRSCTRAAVLPLLRGSPACGASAPLSVWTDGYRCYNSTCFWKDKIEIVLGDRVQNFMFHW